MKALYAGMDIGYRFCVLTFLGENGEKEKVIEFDTSEKNLVEAVKSMRGEVHLMFEECELAGWAYRIVKPLVHRVVVCDPRRNAYVSKEGSKDDRVDSSKLAELLRLNSFKEVFNIDNEEEAAFKKAVQQEIYYTSLVAKTKVKIKSQLRREGLSYGRVKNPFTINGRIALMEEIKSFGIQSLIVQNYKVLEFLTEERDNARREVRKLGNALPIVERLSEIPGCGPVLSARFVAFIQTPFRFSSKRKAWKYCRLGVSKRSSDGIQIGRTRLDKHANGVLKDVTRKVFDAAMKSKSDNMIKRTYLASLERTGNGVHARLNTQRKIVSVMLAMWRSGERYKNDFEAKRT